MFLTVKFRCRGGVACVRPGSEVVSSAYERGANFSGPVTKYPYPDFHSSAWITSPLRGSGKMLESSRSECAS